MYPEPIQRLVALFAKFPTIGQRTAARFVFYLLKLPQSEIEELANSLINLKKQIRLCLFCFNPFDATDLAKEITLCLVCRDKTRTSPLLCVVEKESDLEALEKSRHYKGLYFILGGTVGMLKKEDMKRLRLEELKDDWAAACP
ncbi:MAG: toprim domain-containing protein [Candidatus Wildermuthbacteria bacterium]|nr:toprim domain-containing protein [Candidatus Wildermuthbacteria bacterium]